jgi:FkbM family methyltransferase
MKTFSYKHLTVNYRENSSDEAVLQHSFDNDIFMTSIPYLKRLGPNPVVLDIGAHIGTFSLLINCLFPTSLIYAFEPCDDSFQVLNKNIDCNNLNSRIFSKKIAISDHKGTEKLFYDIESGNWGHSIIKNFGGGFEVVPTITLESFIKDESLQKVDLIKFNVEGAEFKIIKSCPDEVLKKIKTFIILYHEDLAINEDKYMLIKKLKSLGYIVNHIRESEDRQRGWITATKNYYQYIEFSIKGKLKF